MAYSDYGGYAYRNGERVVERSDAVLTTEGLKSTPGMWPGFLLPEGRGGSAHHVILGDGPVHVGLYKQSGVEAYLNGEALELVEFANQQASEWVGTFEWKGESVEHIDRNKFMDQKTLALEVFDHHLEIFWTDYDNYYVFVRLTQPNDVVWTGWSGYGVGAGLEDAGYGWSTESVAAAAEAHWRAAA